MRKLCVSAKFSYQEIRWNYGILCSVILVLFSNNFSYVFDKAWFGVVLFFSNKTMHKIFLTPYFLQHNFGCFDQRCLISWNSVDKPRACFQLQALSMDFCVGWGRSRGGLSFGLQENINEHQEQRTRKCSAYIFQKCSTYTGLTATSPMLERLFATQIQIKCKIE